MHSCLRACGKEQSNYASGSVCSMPYIASTPSFTSAMHSSTILTRVYAPCPADTTGVKANMWTRDINFVSGLQLVDDNKTVHMSYGAFDTDARMLSMTLTDLESHFVEDFDGSRSRVVKVGAGRGKPGKEAAAGQRSAAAADGSREHVRQ